MKLAFLQAGLLCLAATTCLAQAVVSGRITNSLNTPLPDVNLFIETLGKGTTSDRLGRFKFENIPPGTYEILITSIGYEVNKHSITINSAEPVVLAITMEEGMLQLRDVVISDQLRTEVNTISQVDIKLRPVNTSQDILRMVPGLFIAQHAGGGKAEQIFLRGFDIDHGTDINLEVDGLPVNMVSHAHGQGYSDLHFLIPELVSTVDFNKGPYYSDKGNFGTAGYVSFNTASALERNLVKLEGGMFGTLRNVNAVKIIDDNKGVWRQSLYVASEYFRTDGFFESSQDFNRLNLFGKYHATRGDRDALTLTLSTFNSKWNASGQIPERAVKSGRITRFGSIDPTEGGETSRTNVSLRHIKMLNNNAILESHAYLTRYDYNLVSNFTFFLNDPLNGDQITQNESRFVYGYKGSYAFALPLAGVELTTTIGAGFRLDNVNDIHLYNTKARNQFIGDIARGDIDELNAFAYLDESLALSEKLSLNAGVRIDYFTFSYADALTSTPAARARKSVISPKLSFSYQASQNINIFLKSGTGFHSNDARVVTTNTSREILPRAFGMDLGADVKIGEKLLVNGALWLLDLEQEFVYVGDEGIVEPSGKTVRKGIDLRSISGLAMAFC